MSGQRTARTFFFFIDSLESLKRHNFSNVPARLLEGVSYLILFTYRQHCMNIILISTTSKICCNVVTWCQKKVVYTRETRYLWAPDRHLASYYGYCWCVRGNSNCRHFLVAPRISDHADYTEEEWGELSHSAASVKHCWRGVLLPGATTVATVALQSHSSPGSVLRGRAKTQPRPRTPPAAVSSQVHIKA